MSLTDFNLVQPEATKFIGIDNYIRMTTDPTIAQSLIATFKFAADRDPGHDVREPRASRCC